MSKRSDIEEATSQRSDPAEEISSGRFAAERRLTKVRLNRLQSTEMFDEPFNLPDEKQSVDRELRRAVL